MVLNKPLITLLSWSTQLSFTCSKSTTETVEKRGEIYSKLTIKTRIWSHLQKKFFNENLIFSTVVNLELYLPVREITRVFPTDKCF